MAEIIVNVKTGGTYTDGDIIAAKNDESIRLVHAEHICDVRKAGFNRDGLRPLGDLSQHLRRRIRELEIQRISATEATVTNLWTGDVRQGTVSVEWLANRKRHPGHAIYGAIGSEVWYDGRYRFDMAAVQAVWDDIEAHSANRFNPAIHTLMTCGRLEIRSCLVIRTDNFTHEEAGAMCSERYELDANGNPVWLLLDGEGTRRARIVSAVTPTEDPDGTPMKSDFLQAGEDPQKFQWVRPVLEKRDVHVDWRRDLLADLQETEAEILDDLHPIGRDVREPDGSMRYESKVQPIQTDHTKLRSKNSGAPVRRITV